MAGIGDLLLQKTVTALRIAVQPPHAQNIIMEATEEFMYSGLREEKKRCEQFSLQVSL